MDICIRKVCWIYFNGINNVTDIKIIVGTIYNVITSNFNYDHIGKFGYDRVVNNVIGMLNTLKKDGSIVDYEFKAEQSKEDKGLIILNINLTSSLGLKKINLSLSAGPAA